jgi:hypothetical protein
MLYFMFFYILIFFFFYNLKIEIENVVNNNKFFLYFFNVNFFLFYIKIIFSDWVTGTSLKFRWDDR